MYCSAVDQLKIKRILSATIKDLMRRSCKIHRNVLDSSKGRGRGNHVIPCFGISDVTFTALLPFLLGRLLEVKS